MFFRIVNKHGGLYLVYKKRKSFLLLLFRPFLHKNKNQTQGEIIRSTLYDLGPAFIKFGQALSTRSDLVGKDIAQELSYLQDRVPAIKKRYVDQTIKKSFNKSKEQIFLEFSADPVASASIAEVFKAKTTDGKQVAVKVLKPGIKKQFMRDIEFFEWLASLAQKLYQDAVRLKLVEVVKNFKSLVRSELDLRLEAAAISKFRAIHKKDKSIYIPFVDWSRITDEVLTMEWIDGIKISELEKLKKSNYELAQISANLLIMFLRQAFEKGVFHADLHSGNILINKEGQIVLLDFGIVGELDRKSRVYIAEILYGFLRGDYEHVADIHFKAGYVPKGQSKLAFEQACRSIGEPIIGLSANKISIAKLLQQLFNITKEFKMETQLQLILMQKTMVMTEGLCTTLNPTMNVWEVSQPFIEKWARLNLAFDARIIDNIRNYVDKIDYIFDELQNKKNHLYINNTKPLLYFIAGVIIAGVISVNI